MAEKKSAVSKPIRMGRQAYEDLKALMEQCGSSNDKGLKAAATSGETAFLTYVVNEGIAAVKAWLKEQ